MSHGTVGQDGQQGYRHWLGMLLPYHLPISQVLSQYKVGSENRNATVWEAPKVLTSFVSHGILV